MVNYGNNMFKWLPVLKQMPDITLCNCQIKVNEQINTKNTGFANSFSKSAW